MGTARGPAVGEAVVSNFPSPERQFFRQPFAIFSNVDVGEAETWVHTGVVMRQRVQSLS